jgi:hypothetical protein
MTEPRVHRRVVRHRKKRSVPLAKLRTSDVLKTIVDNPRRLEELLRMLEDKDRGIRGRAAATFAKLSESHPTRLIRILARFKDALGDDSAYVRWHIAYALGKLGVRFPMQSTEFLSDLNVCLDDHNRIVRIMAGKAMAQVAARKPAVIEGFFRDLKKEMPPVVARILRNAITKPQST